MTELEQVYQKLVALQEKHIALQEKHQDLRRDFRQSQENALTLVQASKALREEQQRMLAFLHQLLVAMERPEPDWYALRSRLAGVLNRVEEEAEQQEEQHA